MNQELIIDEKTAELIVNFGAFRYGVEKMANILDVDKGIIDKEFKNKNSEFHRLYQKGVDVSDYKIDLKLFELTKAGDLKALEKFEIRRKKNLNR